MESQLRTMFDLQDKMNTKVHPEWRKQGFKFYRAAWIECAELMEHYGYKWWKKQEPDMNQVRLEIVDIWHFVLSEFLLQCKDIDPVIKDFYQTMQRFTYNVNGVLANAEHLVSKLIQHIFIEEIFMSFLNLMNSAGMTFDDLYRLYVGKNVLNFFRQDHGYKEGTYIKIWNGREDNEHLTEIMRSLDPQSSSFTIDLYDKLQMKYNDVLLHDLD